MSDGSHTLELVFVVPPFSFLGAMQRAGAALASKLGAGPDTASPLPWELKPRPVPDRIPFPTPKPLFNPQVNRLHRHSNRVSQRAATRGRASLSRWLNLRVLQQDCTYGGRDEAGLELVRLLDSLGPLLIAFLIRGLVYKPKTPATSSTTSPPTFLPSWVMEYGELIPLETTAHAIFSSTHTCTKCFLPEATFIFPTQVQSSSTRAFI